MLFRSAKKILLTQLESDIRAEGSQLIRDIESKAKDEADKKAKEIIVRAIQRCIRKPGIVKRHDLYYHRTGKKLAHNMYQLKHPCCLYVLRGLIDSHLSEKLRLLMLRGRAYGNNSLTA